MNRNHLCDVARNTSSGWTDRLTDVRCKLWQSSEGSELVTENLSSQVDVVKGIFARGTVHPADRLRNLRNLRGEFISDKGANAFAEVKTVVDSANGYDLVIAKGRI